MKNFVLTAALAFLLSGLTFAQPGTPFASTLPSIPPAIGAPGVSLAWDTTNKLLVITYTVNNSAGTPSTLTTIPYNPHTLEGIGAGGVVFSAGGTIVMLQHNKPTDPLSYSIGTSTTTTTGSVITSVSASCTIVTPTPTGQTACPALPF